MNNNKKKLKTEKARVRKITENVSKQKALLRTLWTEE
jgi:hypothetical protein